VATANKKFGILQVIENKNCVHLLQTAVPYSRVSLSFQARRTGTTIGAIRAGVIAWDGAADTVTSDVVSAWAAAGTNPTLAANWTFENTPIALPAPTTSYQRYTIESIQIDTASTTNVGVFIWTDDTVMDAADILYITDVQLEAGNVATPFERRPFGMELALCQRYYCKTFDYDVAPATNTTDENGCLSARSGGTDGGAVTINWKFPVTMRTNPTVTLYNPNAADSDFDSVVDIASSYDSAGHEMCRILSTAGDPATDNKNYQIHASAVAEL
jgi:hypothetical protein